MGAVMSVRVRHRGIVIKRTLTLYKLSFAQQDGISYTKLRLESAQIL